VTAEGPGVDAHQPEYDGCRPRNGQEPLPRASVPYPLCPSARRLHDWMIGLPDRLLERMRAGLLNC
jgi:hypothetical protein